MLVVTNVKLDPRLRWAIDGTKNRIILRYSFVSALFYILDGHVSVIITEK